MAKDPVEFNRSVCEFWRVRRPELGTGHTLTDFIRSEFIVYDKSKKRSPKYLFRTPTDYWNQFYFSYLNWEAVQPRMQVLRIEDLLSDPEKQLSRLGRLLKLQRRTNDLIAIPTEPVQPSSDKKHAITGSDLIVGKAEASAEDRDCIWKMVNTTVARSFGYVP